MSSAKSFDAVRRGDQSGARRRHAVATPPVMPYATYIGRVGALAVALGVGAVVAGFGGTAWADETAGGTTNSDSSQNSYNSGPAGPTGTDATEGASGPTATDPPASNLASPKLNRTGLHLPRANVRSSGGTLPGARQSGAAAPAPKPDSTSAPEPDSASAPAVSGQRPDSEPSGGAPIELPAPPVPQGTPLLACPQRVNTSALGSATTAATAASPERSRQPLAQTTSEISTGVQRVGDDAAAAVAATTDTLSTAVTTVSTSAASPGVNFSGEQLADTTTLTTQPVPHTLANPPANPITQVLSGLLAAIGLNPNATDSPVPAVPPQTLLGVLELIRREIEATSAATMSPPAQSLLTASDPSFSMTSWLNGASIQPGSSVQLALQQISQAQSLLTQQTWAQGNILAGVASVVPQAFLAQAQWSLTAWQDGNAAALASVANTVGVPIVHSLALLALFANEMLPSAAQGSMDSATVFIPMVGVFGASGAASQALQLLSQAQNNGEVYAVIPVQMKATTEPVIYISVNGGPSVPVLVDTGSAGLVIGAQYVGQQGLGPPTGSGTSGYSGGLTYSYDTYTAAVDFGNGITTGPTSIDVVSPASQDAFASYFAPAGVVGVLGIGPNSGGPGPSIPTAALPGELKDGVLLYEPGGFLVLGPNPLPVRTSVPGAPAANLVVRVGNGSLVPVWVIIDSGGVLGTMPSYVIGDSQLSGSLPAGTLISVYAADGQTLLYSYTTDGFNTPSVTSGTYLNTGYTPFEQGAVYVGFSGAGGIGTTSFDYT